MLLNIVFNEKQRDLYFCTGGECSDVFSSYPSSQERRRRGDCVQIDPKRYE